MAPAATAGGGGNAGGDFCLPGIRRRTAAAVSAAALAAASAALCARAFSTARAAFSRARAARSLALTISGASDTADTASGTPSSSGSMEHTDSRYSDLEHVHCVVSGQESHVSRALEFAGDLGRCLDFSNCDDTIAGLLHCISDQLGSLSISFGAENIGDNFLFFAFDVEFLLLSVLLGNLLLFNSVHEITSELHVRQRHIVDDNVVFEGTLLEHLTDFL